VTTERERTVGLVHELLDRVLGDLAWQGDPAVRFVQAVYASQLAVLARSVRDGRTAGELAEALAELELPG